VAAAVIPPLGEPERGTLEDLLAVFARRWRVIATTAVLVVGVTATYCSLTVPRYRARATVMIEARAPEILSGQQFGAPQDPLTGGKYDYYQTQFQLLRSPSLGRRVIADLDLANDPRFVELDDPATAAPPSDASLVGRYLSALGIAPVRGTRLVTVEFESPDAELAAEIANTHARLFVRRGLEQLYAAIEQIQTFLKSKLVELQPRLQEAERRLLQFQSVHRLLPVDLGKDVASERMMDLSRRLTAAEAERIALEAEYRLVQRREYDSLPAVLTNGLIQRLREDYDRLEVEHALLAQKFRPTYPKLRQLSGQLAHARDLLSRETAKVVGGIEAQYLAAERTVEQLKAELEGQRHSLLERKDAEGEFLTLVREAETTRALYDSLLTRIKDLNIKAGVNTSNITLVEPASPPRSPATPDTPFNLLLSLVTGLFVGTGFAFLRDARDHTIRDARDLRRATGLGTLAVVPDFHTPPPGTLRDRLRWQTARGRRMAATGWRRLRHFALRNGSANGAADAILSPPLLLANGSVPLQAEAYRTLRTSLLVSRSAAPRTLLITSATSGEGKTTTAVNVAAALARCGTNVLLIDGDLRLPRCHEAFGLPVGPGLGEYLADELAAAPIVATHVPNLALLPAGRALGNPAELLSAPRMHALLREARARFEFVVIDSPPLLAVSDGLLLANLTEGVVVVVERDRSRHDRVRLALQRLHESGALPLGTVLNRGTVESEYYRYSRPVTNGHFQPAHLRRPDLDLENLR
jgi:capsular exopolysaccharide synthesis family protein